MPETESVSGFFAPDIFRLLIFLVTGRVTAVITFNNAIILLLLKSRNLPLL